MKKTKFTFNLRSDRDRLAFNPNPYRDWAILFVTFIIISIIATFVHLGIYLYLQRSELNAVGDSSLQSINEEKLNQAVEIIKGRNRTSPSSGGEVMTGSLIDPRP